MDPMFEQELVTAKRGRKSTPKVRSGCVTCKARRVKCDEQKPECQRCLRANRKCEGYEYSDHYRATLTHQLPLEPASIATYSIPFKIPGSQADRQLLHYYCCRAAWNLSSCIDPTLWTVLILQRAAHEPVIRNALIALSSLHKDYLCGELVGTNYETLAPYAHLPPVTNLKTMGMISRCHRQLRHYLSRPDASPDVALVCSVIFYTFESLMGESHRAVWHLDQGLILLRKCQMDKSFCPDDPLIATLTTLLHHLDLQASCFDDRRPPIFNLVTDTEALGRVDVVPDSFLDIIHMEAVLTKLRNWTLHHLVNYVHFRGAPIEQLPSQFFFERLLLAAQYRKFESVLDRFVSYEGLISNTSAHIRQEDQRHQRTQRILCLRINLHTFSYLIKEDLTFPELDAYHTARKFFDMLPGYNRGRFADEPIDADRDLKSALNAVDALVAQLTMDANFTSPQDSDGVNLSRSYTLATNLISGLYFLSLKTTNKQVLEKAISLFSHPQLYYARDGLWDSRTAAFVVENLVKIRQSGNVTQGRDAGDILMQVPEETVNGDLVELQRVFQMSEKMGLPMMQSKKFSLVLRSPKCHQGLKRTDRTRREPPAPELPFQEARNYVRPDIATARIQRSVNMMCPCEVHPMVPCDNDDDDEHDLLSETADAVTFFDTRFPLAKNVNPPLPPYQQQQPQRHEGTPWSRGLEDKKTLWERHQRREFCGR